MTGSRLVHATKRNTDLALAGDGFRSRGETSTRSRAGVVGEQPVEGTPSGPRASRDVVQIDH